MTEIKYKLFTMTRRDQFVTFNILLPDSVNTFVKRLPKIQDLFLLLTFVFNVRHPHYLNQTVCQTNDKQFSPWAVFMPPINQSFVSTRSFTYLLYDNDRRDI